MNINLERAEVIRLIFEKTERKQLVANIRNKVAFKKSGINVKYFVDLEYNGLDTIIINVYDGTNTEVDILIKTSTISADDFAYKIEMDNSVKIKKNGDVL